LPVAPAPGLQKEGDIVYFRFIAHVDAADHTGSRRSQNNILIRGSSAPDFSLTKMKAETSGFRKRQHSG
jgi:hypothetical protein